MVVSVISHRSCYGFQLTYLPEQAQDNVPQFPLKRGHSEDDIDDADATSTKHQKSGSDGPCPQHPSAFRLTTSDRRSLRAIYEEIVHAQYPSYKPRSDFELLVLGGRGYSDGEGLEACLEEEWSAFVSEMRGDSEAAMREVRRALDASAEVTGVSVMYCCL